MNDSTSRLTDDDVRAIQQRAKQVTPGPWESNRWTITADASNAVDHMIGRVWRGPLEDDPWHFRDAAFIAAARTDVPALCADLLDARVEIERLRKERVVKLETWREWLNRWWEESAKIDPSHSGHVPWEGLTQEEASRQGFEAALDACREIEALEEALRELVDGLKSCDVRSDVPGALPRHLRNYLAAEALIGEYGCE